jgi:hypothetical protein
MERFLFNFAENQLNQPKIISGQYIHCYIGKNIAGSRFLFTVKLK